VLVEKPEEGNVDAGNMIVESLVLCRSGRAPGTLEEESAGCPCKYKDCSRFLGTGRENPCCRTKKTRTEYGVDQNLTTSLNLRGAQLGRTGVWSRKLCVEKHGSRLGEGCSEVKGKSKESVVAHSMRLHTTTLSGFQRSMCSAHLSAAVNM
jgi:hypothetical protein